MKFENGVWPVMLTPFTEDNEVDYSSLGKLVDWYIENGVAGLFSVCQSSEMFYLNLEERCNIAKFVKEKSAGRVPVIASGHISNSMEDQIYELNAMANTGIDALILITNRLASETEDDTIWLNNLKTVMECLPKDIPLGFYECPYPYKRLISLENLEWCANTGRFYFLKDTSCDIENMRGKLDVIRGTNLKLYNANSATLLETLEMGAAGFSGVMANFHPELYVWLTKHYRQEKMKARKLADFLTIASLIEKQCYPVNAKYYQSIIGNFQSIYSRTMDSSMITAMVILVIEQLTRLTKNMEELLLTDINETICIESEN